jgi:hypothetical protein
MCESEVLSCLTKFERMLRVNVHLTDAAALLSPLSGSKNATNTQAPPRGAGGKHEGRSDIRKQFKEMEVGDGELSAYRQAMLLDNVTRRQLKLRRRGGAGGWGGGGGGGLAVKKN